MGSEIEIKVSRVRLDRDGYDKSGCYFGTGARLFRAVIDDGADIRTEYIRSGDYQSARAHFKSRGKVSR
jgi:hypothetical protein